MLSGLSVAWPPLLATLLPTDGSLCSFELDSGSPSRPFSTLHYLSLHSGDLSSIISTPQLATKTEESRPISNILLHVSDDGFLLRSFLLSLGYTAMITGEATFWHKKNPFLYPCEQHFTEHVGCLHFPFPSCSLCKSKQFNLLVDLISHQGPVLTFHGVS